MDKHPPPEILKLLNQKRKAEPPEEVLFTLRSLPSSSRHSDSQTESTYIVTGERMKLYRSSKNKRTELASGVSFISFRASSNEAFTVQGIASRKDVIANTSRTLPSTSRHSDSQSESSDMEIEEHMKVKDTNTGSIQDILAENPLPGAKIGATAEASYFLYNYSGFTVQEIASKRGAIAETILSHLIDGIKAGYPIKLIDLCVTDEIRDAIVNIIRNPPINSDMSDPKKIKGLCPPDITTDAVRIVIAYLQVRNHLQKLNVKHEDFESPIDGSTQLHHVSTEENTSENVKNKKIKLSTRTSQKVKNMSLEASLGENSSKYTCKCGKVLDNKYNFTSHKKFHSSPNNKYICPTCGMWYGRKWTLTEHIKVVHSSRQGEQPFQCSWDGCGKRFSRWNTLARHARIHTGEKNFACPVCNKKSIRSDQRSIHARTHPYYDPSVFRQQRAPNTDFSINSSDENTPDIVSDSMSSS